MYVAEHLDLITNVKDNFTSPLMRLSGLLEEVGLLADELDPIRIRVNVHGEQDLRQLERRMTSVQAMEATTMATGGSGGAHSMTDVVADATAGGTVASGLAARSDGGSSNQLFGATDIRRLQDSFGLDFATSLTNQDVSPANFLTGEQPLFGVSEGEIAEQLSPKTFARAFDFDRFVENSMLGMAANPSRKDLAGVSPQLMLEAVPDDIARSMDEFANEFFDQRRLMRGQLREALLDVRVGMTQFYDMLAAIVPLMGVFIGAIPAAVGALGGLAVAAVGAAGALGAIGGLGFLGAATAEAGGQMPGMDDFTSVIEDLPEELFEAFRPVAERLEPLFRDALEGLERLFDEIGRRSEALLMLRDEARAFGQWVIPFLANVTEKLIYLADAASPVFGMIADALGDRDVIGGFAGALEEALPQLARMTSIILDALPSIFSFSMGMLTMATHITSALSSVLGFATSMMELIPFVEDGDRALGMFFSTLMTTASALFITSKATALYTTLTGIAQGSTLSLASAVMVLKRALLGLLVMTGIGALMGIIGEGVSMLSGQFTDLDSSVSEATDSLKEFQRQQSSMSSRGRYMGSLDETAYIDVTENNQQYNIEGTGREARKNAETASFVNDSTSTY